MARYRKRIGWKGILSAALAILVVAGAAVGLVKLTGNDSRTVGGSAFSVGGIDLDTGKGTSVKTSIYTKDRVACQGLEIVPDFDNTSTYRVFFYNEDDMLVGTTEERDDTFVSSEIPACAQYARFVIYPSTLDEDGKQIEDFKVRLWEVLGIANDMKITVNKKQLSQNVLETAVKVEYSDTLVYPPVADVLIEGATYDAEGTAWSAIGEAEDGEVLVMDVTELAKLKISVTSDAALKLYFVDASGAAIGNTSLTGGETEIVPVSRSAAFAIFPLTEGAEIVVTEYMPR